MNKYQNLTRLAQAVVKNEPVIDRDRQLELMNSLFSLMEAEFDTSDGSFDCVLSLSLVYQILTVARVNIDPSRLTHFEWFADTFQDTLMSLTDEALERLTLYGNFLVSSDVNDPEFNKALMVLKLGFKS